MKPEELLNIGTPFSWKNELRDILYKDHPETRPKDGNLRYTIFVDEFSSLLEKQPAQFGAMVLNDMPGKRRNAYLLSIPSEIHSDIGHAAVMMIDNERKETLYADPHGKDMPKELKDFVEKLMPGYQINRCQKL